MNKKEILIHHYLNQLKEKSQCIDKQVACVITDASYEIISTVINRVIFCDQNCNDKINRRCFTVHAEIIAIANLKNFKDRAKKAYINLFPCPPCQNGLSHFVEEIVVFGPKHKDQVFNNIRLEPDLNVELLDNNETPKQLSVVQGELSELITGISDYFYRGDKLIPMEELLDEIVDAELMLAQLKLICWKEDNQTFNLLRKIRAEKYLKVLNSAMKGVYRDK